jgi:hypothetical protein
MVIVVPFGPMPPRERLSTAADVVGIVAAVSAALFPWIVVWLSRLRIKAKLKAILSAAFFAGGALAYAWSLRTRAPSPLDWFAFGSLATGLVATGWRAYGRKRREIEIVDTISPAPTDKHVDKLGPSAAIDRVLESELDAVRELCAPDHINRAVALLAFPDRTKLAFRVHTVSTDNLEFYAAVHGLELPFLKITTVAGLYNKFVDDAHTDEGQRVDRLERLKLYRNSLNDAASVCAYTALRNRPYCFRKAYLRCMVSRFEFLDELSEKDRLRFQYGDLIGAPVKTTRGIVGVVIIASLAGTTLTYQKEHVRAVVRNIGHTIESLPRIRGLEHHPATIALGQALPARDSARFEELVSLMRPDFSRHLPLKLIDQAVTEHKNRLDDWCESARLVRATSPAL